MRRLTLPGTFLLLLAALYVLWQYRFERSPEFRTCDLADLRAASQLPSKGDWTGSESGPRLRLQAGPSRKGVVARLILPIDRPVDFLQLRFRASAFSLVPGREFWEDGRCLIEWHSPGEGLKWENDPFCSAQYDQTGEITEIVMRPEKPPATPVLRVENLGVSGDYELSVFEATVLRERLVWKIGRWFLLAGSLAWAIAWIQASAKPDFFRSLLAASTWLLMVVYFVIPGPWNDVRSIVMPFQTGDEIKASQGAPESGDVKGIQRRNFPPVDPETIESVGKVPLKGDLALRLKLYAQKARPLLHILLLFAPTFIIACLVGRKPATSLCIILALAIEAAQLAFGFGFDWVDVFDLASDVIGILLALVAHHRLKRRSQWVG